jgi:hypothetical protein
MAIENLKEVESKAGSAADAIISKAEKVIGEKQGDGLKKCPLCGEEFDVVEIGADAPELKELKPYISGEVMSVALAAKQTPPAATLSDEVGRRLKELEPIAGAIREITNAMVRFKKACAAAKGQSDIEDLKTLVLKDIDRSLNKLFQPQQQQQ